MNALVPYKFEAQEVRVVDQDGNPWFVGTDVARVLGYKNPRDAIRRHCKGVRETLTPSDGGDQMTGIIPEGDVYRLIIKSKLAAAQRFEAWVMEEVLPTIRRTGQFNLKAEALDRIATASNSLCVTDAAKVLQIPPRKLFSYLHAQSWIYRRPGGAVWLGYSERTKQGLLEHKVHTHEGGDGNPRVREQVRVTPKGLAHLAQVFSSQAVAA